MRFSKRLISVFRLTILVSFICCGFARAETPASDGVHASASDEVRDATLRFYVALNSIYHGDIDPMSSVWSHRSDVTNLSTNGNRAAGWNEVYADYQNLARQNPGGRTVPKDILVVADGELGYSVCSETGQTRSAEGPIVNFSQRATNIFRREAGKWKMIHHHVDDNAIGAQNTR